MDPPPSSSVTDISQNNNGWMPCYNPLDIVYFFNTHRALPRLRG